MFVVKTVIVCIMHALSFGIRRNRVLYPCMRGNDTGNSSRQSYVIENIQRAFYAYVVESRMKRSAGNVRDDNTQCAAVGPGYAGQSCRDGHDRERMVDTSSSLNRPYGRKPDVVSRSVVTQNTQHL